MCCTKELTVSGVEGFPGELDALRSDNARLRRLLQLSEEQARAAASDQATLTGAPASPVTMGSSSAEKVRFFVDLKKTDLAPLTIQDLRHTYASLARKSGADLRYVQKTMGHSTPTVTANIYSDLYADELDQVATNLDQLHATEIQTKTGQEPDEINHPPSA
jgi:integrase